MAAVANYIHASKSPSHQQGGRSDRILKHVYAYGADKTAVTCSTRFLFLRHNTLYVTHNKECTIHNTENTMM